MVASPEHFKCVIQRDVSEAFTPGKSSLADDLQRTWRRDSLESTPTKGHTLYLLETFRKTHVSQPLTVAKRVALDDPQS